MKSILVTAALLLTIALVAFGQTPKKTEQELLKANRKYDGNTAVMTGRFTAKGTFRNKHIDIRERYTAVWVKRDGRGLLLSKEI